MKTYVYRRPWTNDRRRKRVAVGGKALGAYTITAEAGSFAVSGQDVGLRASRVISPIVGQLFVTGNDVGLVHGTPGAYTLPAGVGSFALTGQTVSLTVARKLSVAAGVFTVTGQNVTLTYAAATPQASGRLEFTVADSRLKYTAPDSRLGYTVTQ